MNRYLVPPLACLLAVSCQSTDTLPKAGVVPSPAPEPLPAWTKASTRSGGQKVRIEIKMVEVSYEEGTPEIPSKRYEKRLKQSE